MSNSSALLPKEEKQRLMSPGALPNAADKERHHAHGDFNRFIGEVPFVDPNVHSPEDLEKIINKGSYTNNSCGVSCGCLLCALTGVGLCYLCCSQKLIEQGELGFSVNNGRPEVLLPGRHLLISPLNRFNRTYTMAADLIEQYPITIVRVPVGSLGLAHDNAHPVVLLPGLHCMNDGNWRFIKPPGVGIPQNGNHCIRADQEVIDFGPIKFVTVKSGTVRVCYLRGKVHIFEEGRYAVNDPTCIVSNLIKTQQQNLLFTDHPVLLDGGISMLVKGLLTFQVVDVEKLIKKLGDRDLMRALEDVCQAEMSRVFSGVHLEQISTAMAAQGGAGGSRNKQGDAKDAKSAAAAAPGGLLGAAGAVAAQSGGAGGEGTSDSLAGSRSLICQQVIDFVTATSKEWGVEIINFQLESLKLADAKYARDYEEASLAMAKAKANLRAVNAENDILLSRSNAQASAAKIDAEGKKQALIIKSQAEAEARKIEADARNKAAMAMNDPFAKQFALSGQQVEFARALKANVLTILPDSAIGKPFVSQSMFNPAAGGADNKQSG